MCDQLVTNTGNSWVRAKYTPIHESSAFQLFIFHIYISSFSFLVIIRNANSHKDYVIFLSQAPQRNSALHFPAKKMSFGTLSNQFTHVTDKKNT